MTDHAFLSPRRRAILEGEDADDMGVEPATYRSHKAETKRQARQALQELTDVARSPYIDHTDVFDAGDVFEFVRELSTASHPDHYDADRTPGGLITDDDLDDDFLAYRDRLYVQLDKFLKFQQSTE